LKSLLRLAEIYPGFQILPYSPGVQHPVASSLFEAMKLLPLSAWSRLICQRSLADKFTLSGAEHGMVVDFAYYPELVSKFSLDISYLKFIKVGICNATGIQPTKKLI
jgi:hypothetical protein